jgi:hypothetical protein
VDQLLVVSDTAPLDYLVLTGDIALLPKLFDRVLVPQAVCDELASPEGPAAVHAWIARAPAWIEVRPNPDVGDRDDRTGPKLDRGRARGDWLGERIGAGIARARAQGTRSGKASAGEALAKRGRRSRVGW